MNNSHATTHCLFVTHPIHGHTAWVPIWYPDLLILGCSEARPDHFNRSADIHTGGVSC